MAIKSSRFRNAMWMPLALVAVVATATLTNAKPPAPPAPPPPGSIFFLQPGQQTDYQMKADGSGKTPILPGNAFLEVSYRRYGSDGARWIVRWEHLDDPEYPNRGEIFATRIVNGAVSRRVQVTNMYPFISPWTNHVSAPRQIRWTKGTDGFFSFAACEYVLDASGQPIDFGPDHLFRVNVSAADLEAATANGGSFQPVDIDGDPRMVQVFSNLQPAPSATIHFAWSPEGSYLAWAQGARLAIYRGLGTASPTVTEMPTTAQSINWSVAGDKVVVKGKPDNLTSSGIVVVDPVAATATLVKATTTSAEYGGPAWSPQGAHLVALKRAYKKNGGGNTLIVRLNADGTNEATVTELYAAIVQGGNDFVWEWASDDIAP
jgi:hypothetical protein